MKIFRVNVFLPRRTKYLERRKARMAKMKYHKSDNDFFLGGGGGAIFFYLIIDSECTIVCLRRCP